MNQIGRHRGRGAVQATTHSFWNASLSRLPRSSSRPSTVAVPRENPSYYRAWHLTAADGTTLNISPMGNLRTNSGAVLIVAALAGHGLACLPTYLVGDALQSGRLVTVLDDYMGLPYTLSVQSLSIGQGARLRRLSRGTLWAGPAMGQLVPGLLASSPRRLLLTEGR